jgi:hypothetical protein
MKYRTIRGGRRDSPCGLHWMRNSRSKYGSKLRS